jgi:5-methyltetrahydrofolate--homocysteine methyltransferase
VIRDIHEKYLAAGADLIETNTFGATTIAQEDYTWPIWPRDEPQERPAGARGLRQVQHARTRVAGALGPTPKTASISPDVNDPGARNITSSSCARPIWSRRWR